MKKKILIVVGIILVLAAAGGTIFKMKLSQMEEEVKMEFEKLEEVDLSSVADGTYSVKWGKFVNNADLDVIVKGGKIEKINMKKMDAGSGYEALETLDRIIENQKVKVDAVTGATTSSKVIMITTAKALEKK